jgi:uncharacterized repeat protein (TIGR03987 family)
MKPVLIVGTIVVNLALVSYSIGVIAEQRRRRVTNLVLWFLSIGVTLDIVATACMITGSSQGLFTPHGILGYSSLIAMLTDTILIWRFRMANGQAEVPSRLHLYSRYAYIWWLIAYATGAIMVMSRRAA